MFRHHRSSLGEAITRPVLRKGCRSLALPPDPAGDRAAKAGALQASRVRLGGGVGVLVTYQVPSRADASKADSKTPKNKGSFPGVSPMPKERVTDMTTSAASRPEKYHMQPGHLA